MAEACYPYTVSCTGYQVATGHICPQSVELSCPVAVDDHYLSPDWHIDMVVDAPGVLANDISDSGKALSVANPGVGVLDGGVLILNADGSFAINASANASYTYVATDGDCESDAAAVTFNITDLLPCL